MPFWGRSCKSIMRSLLWDLAKKTVVFKAGKILDNYATGSGARKTKVKPWTRSR